MDKSNFNFNSSFSFLYLFNSSFNFFILYLGIKSINVFDSCYKIKKLYIYIHPIYKILIIKIHNSNIIINNKIHCTL